MSEEVKNWQKLTIVGKLFHKMGLALLKTTAGQLTALFFRAFWSLFHSESRSFKTDTRNIILQTFFTGVEIFPILFVVAALFGSVVIIEVITLTGKMGFSDVVGTLIVVVVIRELGPILTAFPIAGRSGSSLTTYVGGMVIDSEVDALASMGIDPIRYLVMPGLIGGMIATFMMTILFSATAIFCGFGLTKALILASGNIINIQLTWDYLSTELIKAISLNDFIIVIVKPVVFGAIITCNACYQALNIPRDIRQVPKATSRSVIRSFLYVVLSDVAISLFYLLDYYNELSKLI